MNKQDYILICEDNLPVLQITRFALEAEGFNVETATNTDEVYQNLEKDIKPSLIILDLNIPQVGGESVIHSLRSREETKSIPIILFSGKKTWIKSPPDFRLMVSLENPLITMN